MTREEFFELVDVKAYEYDAVGLIARALEIVGLAPWSCPEVDGTGEDDGITGVLRPACLVPPASEPEAWGETEACRLRNAGTAGHYVDFNAVAAEAARIEAEHAAVRRQAHTDLLNSFQDALRAVDTLTRERDAARAEAERLTASAQLAAMTAPPRVLGLPSVDELRAFIQESAIPWFASDEACIVPRGVASRLHAALLARREGAGE